MNGVDALDLDQTDRQTGQRQRGDDEHGEKASAHPGRPLRAWASCDRPRACGRSRTRVRSGPGQPVGRVQLVHPVGGVIADDRAPAGEVLVRFLAPSASVLADSADLGGPAFRAAAALRAALAASAPACDTEGPGSAGGRYETDSGEIIPSCRSAMASTRTGDSSSARDSCRSCCSARVWVSWLCKVSIRC